MIRWNKCASICAYCKKLYTQVKEPKSFCTRKNDEECMISYIAMTLSGKLEVSCDACIRSHCSYRDNMRGIEEGDKYYPLFNKYYDTDEGRMKNETKRTETSVTKVHQS